MVLIVSQKLSRSTCSWTHSSKICCRQRCTTQVSRHKKVLQSGTSNTSPSSGTHDHSVVAQTTQPNVTMAKPMIRFLKHLARRSMVRVVSPIASLNPDGDFDTAIFSS